MKNYIKKLQEILKGTYLLDELELSEIAEMIKDGERIEDIEEYIQERINEIEVIYYSTAMDILSKEDPSLVTSLDIAKDLGYTLDRLNSELLATLLLQDICKTELAENLDAISELVKRS